MSLRRASLVAAALAAVIASGWLAGVRLSPLVDPASHARVAAFIRGLVPPDVSPAFLAVVGRAALRTLAIALIGTALSLVIAVPLGALATASLFRRGPLLAGEPRGWSRGLFATASRLARGLLGLLRAVPDLVWAMIFVVGLGLGPVPGVLALAVSYGGMLGRVFADLFEDVDPGPLIALQTTGARRLAVFAFGIWPQALPSVVAYTLYSFECCVRAAAVAGLVGAGGIGYELALSMRELAYGEITTLTAALLAVMWLAELASALLRRLLRANAPPGLLAHRRTPPPASLLGFTDGRRHASPGSPFPVLPAVAAACGVAVLAAAWSARDTFDAAAAGRMARFVAQAVPPELARSYLRTLIEPLAQTVAISLVGTLIGVVIGGLLGIPAIAAHAEADRAHGAARLARSAVRRLARGALLVLRAIPDVLWVLVFLLAVGLGPFAGALALGVHTGGVLGRLYADTLEEVSPLPLRGLRATGATPLQLLVWGAWPEARRALVSYTMLRWEMNLRASTVVGLAGGGGIGMALYNDLQLGRYPRVATLVLLIGLLVAATGAIGDGIRKRLASASQAV